MRFYFANLFRKQIFKSNYNMQFNTQEKLLYVYLSKSLESPEIAFWFEKLATCYLRIPRKNKHFRDIINTQVSNRDRVYYSFFSELLKIMFHFWEVENTF